MQRLTKLEPKNQSILWTGMAPRLDMVKYRSENQIQMELQPAKVVVLPISC